MPLLQVGQVTATGMQLSQSALAGQSTPQYGPPLRERRMGVCLWPTRLGGVRGQHLKAWVYFSIQYRTISRVNLQVECRFKLATLYTYYAMATKASTDFHV